MPNPSRRLAAQRLRLSTELFSHAQMTSRTTVIQGLSSRQSRQNMSHMIGRHVCAGCLRRSKKWGTTYSFKGWDESPSGCTFSRAANTIPDLQHRDCVACGWVYMPEDTTQCVPVSSLSASTSPMNSTPPREIPRPNPAIPTQCYVRPQDLKHKAAIPITMYPPRICTSYSLDTELQIRRMPMPLH